MEAAKRLRVGRLRRRPARDGHVREEQAEHRARARDRHAAPREREAGLEPRAARARARPDARLGERAQRRDARRHRERIAGERARLVDGPERSDLLHDLAPPAVRADGQPAADHLAERRQVGRDAVQRLRAARSDAEAGHHLVEDQQRAVRRRVSSRQPFEEARPRQDEAHVAGDRLDDDGGDRRRARRRARSTASRSLYGAVSVSAHGARRARRASRAGRASRRPSPPGRAGRSAWPW